MTSNGITVINDLHLGARRQGGTTPASQEALRGYLQASFDKFLQSVQDRVLVIAGDLFDGFDVETRDVITAYDSLSSFLHKRPGTLASLAPENGLVLVAGNHDWSPRGDKVSSFHLLAHMLKSRFGGRVLIVDHSVGLSKVVDGVWAIPHMPNQDLFNLELTKALKVSELKFLILHANYDNKFTMHSDHSLNVSREVAQMFAELDVTLVFAHEHQRGSDLGGKVRIMGNPYPSSVADCLNNLDKVAHRIGGAGLEELLPTWSRTGAFGYAEIDWRELNSELESGEGFIRVVGEASTAEAEKVVDAIAAYRAKSNAFVVSNAVKIEGLAEMTSVGAVSAEAIKSFDVLAALLQECDEREREVINKVLA